jgi:hypothetical protein
MYLLTSHTVVGKCVQRIHILLFHFDLTKRQIKVQCVSRMPRLKNINHGTSEAQNGTIVRQHSPAQKQKQRFSQIADTEIRCD